MIEIKRYKEKYKSGVQSVCLETSAFPLSKAGMRKFLLLAYCDYYIEAEKENCFVAVDENDRVLGYILCSENFERYRHTFCGLYYPEIKALGAQYAVMAKGEVFSHLLFSKSYPAHLHIDLSDSCRRQGVGTRLMERLKKELSEKGVHSLMLVCSSNNKAAVNFYIKNGFKIKVKIFSSCFMTCKF